MARLMSALVVLAVIAMAVPSAQAWGTVELNTGCSSGRCGCSTSNANAASSYCASQTLPAGSTCTSIIDKICKQMDFITYYSTSVINNIKVNIDVVAKSTVALTPNSAVATVTTGGQAIANGPGAATTFTSDSGTETNVGTDFSSSVGGSTVSASSQITPTTIATCPTTFSCSPTCGYGKTCKCTITNNAPVYTCVTNPTPTWGRRLAA